MERFPAGGVDPRKPLDAIEHVSDVFCVLDDCWRFAYVNPAAEKMLGRGREGLIGRVAWDEFPEAAGRRIHRELARAMEEGTAVAFEARSRVFDAHVSVRAHPVPGGLAVFLWDASEQRTEEVERERLYRERSRVARVLQRTLLPASLPTVPGVEVGVRYVAAGEGFEVGGDFYDLFGVRDGAWGTVVGDITGKGPEAAALISFARHIVRSAAARTGPPREVLLALNEEILRQVEDDKLFTVVYCEVLPDGDGAELRLACGGHPPPLILRADDVAGATVEWFSYSGMVLGASEAPNVSGWTTRLSAGEVAVFYTDGVTEARNPQGEFFGETRLAELVEGCAGLPAEQTAGRIEETVMAFQENRARDDLAVLVLRASETPEKG